MDKMFLFVFGGVFGLVGLVFLSVAGFTLHSEIEFRRTAVAAPAVVTGLEATRGSEGGTLYKPVFRFTDNDDRVRTVTSSVASSPPSYHQGESVTVLFAAEHPEQAHIDDFMEAWFLPLIFGVLGTAFTGIAAGCGIPSLRRIIRRQSPN